MSEDQIEREHKLRQATKGLGGFVDVASSLVKRGGHGVRTPSKVEFQFLAALARSCLVYSRILEIDPGLRFSAQAS